MEHRTSVFIVYFSWHTCNINVKIGAEIPIITLALGCYFIFKWVKMFKGMQDLIGLGYELVGLSGLNVWKVD